MSVGSKPAAAPLSLPALAGRSSLREQVGDVLRAALVSAEMTPGRLYSAPALAARFGVSATPVREAMLDLAKQGLVVAVPNKGFRVTVMEEADLDAVTEVRALLEPPTVARVATTAAAADLRALRPLARAIAAAARRSDLVGYVEADRAFHLRLLSLAGNPRLVDVVADLRARTRLYGLADLADRGELAGSAAEHLELLDLLLARDASGAERLMRRHVGHVRGVWAGRPEPRLPEA